jgi:hypothetical protein
VTADVTRREIAELTGLLSALSGTIGSILLAFPLFHLLRAREAIEDIERNLHTIHRTDDRSVEMEAALAVLRLHVRQRRRTAVRVGIAGVILLILTGVLLLGQTALLYL